MNTRSLVKIRFVILFCLLSWLGASCTEQFTVIPSPTLKTADTTVKTTQPSEETVTKSPEEMEITVPAETSVEPTKEPAATDPALSTKTPLVGIGVGEAEMVAKTKTHLATRLGVSEEEITVVELSASRRGILERHFYP